ncbi:hypothetical protein ACRXCV_00125 (plasmid) [Halobacteriovorax sp. GFR7]|uniref:hypothetical protein n=1 Tax=unclassified Halobacteriovorax TaxID=2639665 RepID=UPI003D95CDF0
MNAHTLLTNADFLVIATSDALMLISKDTGISVEALVAQYPSNEALQARVQDMVKYAAEVVAEELRPVVEANEDVTYEGHDEDGLATFGNVYF